MDTTTIVFTTTYLLIIFLAFWVVSKGGWWAKIFLALYVIAILPNLIALTGNFTLDRLVMAWFDSLYLYILLPLYVIIQLIMRLGEKGWLGNWLAKKTLTRTRLRARSTPVERMEQEVLKCLDELERSDG